MEIANIQSLAKGDTILIEGFLDNEIVRIAAVNEEAIIFPITEKLHFKLTKGWDNLFKKYQ